MSQIVESTNHQNKATLRKVLRAKRRALTAKQQKQAADRFLKHFKTTLNAPSVKRIAVYLSSDGELDLTPLIQHCWRQHIEVYLPVLHRFRRSLWFAQYTHKTQLLNNRFAIPEPANSKLIRPWQLNRIFLPLVGFDEHGGRLGMGGGFYDRTLSQQNRWPSKPKLIGVAHDVQRVERIPLEPWDIPLDMIASPSGQYKPL